MLDRSRNAMVLRARSLRREMTLPEGLLWRELRKRPGGCKFRRQHPIGNFVVDFNCSAAKVVVEVDGEAHARGDNPRLDRERGLQLSEQGLRVLRVAASDVLRDLDSVIRQILGECRR